MKCLFCKGDFKIQDRKTSYCSRECWRDYNLKRAIFNNKYSKQIAEYNREYSEKIDQMKANEWYLGRY